VHQIGALLVADAGGMLDDAGYSRCLEELRPGALRFARGMLAGDLARAEELVQEALLRVHASRDRCRQSGEDLRRYAFRVLTNACLDELRRCKTGAAALRGAAELAAGRAERSAGAPDRELLRSERRAAVTAAIGRLPERERAALMLREIGGQSYAQIAGELDTSVSDVNNLIHRARTRFSKLMRPWME
jgi:RNA polymerase sigma-70 factor (ECF subfamily)